MLFIELFFTLLALMLADTEPVSIHLETTHIEAIIHIGDEVNERELVLHPDEGKLYHGVQPFSGFSISYYENGQLAEKSGYLKGKRQGISQKWFESGLLSYEATYASNKLHGPSKSWWENGNQRSESNFIAGKVEGEQTQWYTSGSLFKKINILEGKEEGLQQAWRENGKLYANYEAKNGRIFGLKRANLCYELNDETIEYANWNSISSSSDYLCLCFFH